MAVKSPTWVDEVKALVDKVLIDYPRHHAVLKTLGKLNYICYTQDGNSGVSIEIYPYESSRSVEIKYFLLNPHKELYHQGKHYYHKPFNQVEKVFDYLFAKPIEVNHG